jgi:hypothetical protein
MCNAPSPFFLFFSFQETPFLSLSLLLFAEGKKQPVLFGITLMLWVAHQRKRKDERERAKGTQSQDPSENGKLQKKKKNGRERVE